METVDGARGVKQAQPEGIRLLLVDDHAILRMGMTHIFDRESDMTVISHAGDGDAAVASFRQNRPDITLLDLKLPGMTGVQTLIAIRSEFPAARVIILTAFARDEDIYAALRAGAMGFLIKDTPTDEILEAIRTVHQGRRHFPPRVTEKLAQRLTMPDLSERELEVLKLMADGMSNKEIAASLSLAIGTVKYHINNILSKLNVDDRTQAVIVALKKGLAELRE